MIGPFINCIKEETQLRDIEEDKEEAGRGSGWRPGEEVGRNKETGIRGTPS